MRIRIFAREAGAGDPPRAVKPDACRRRQKHVVSVYDLVLANYGLDRGLEDSNAAENYGEIKAYTPARGEQITGVPAYLIEKLPVSLPTRRTKRMDAR